MKICCLFQFPLSFKTVAHILLLAPFQGSADRLTSEQHPISKVKPSNQSSPPSISNNPHKNTKTLPEKKSHFPQGSFSQKPGSQNQSYTQSHCRYLTQMCWYLQYKGYFPWHWSWWVFEFEIQGLHESGTGVAIPNPSQSQQYFACFSMQKYVHH